jgi:hypothetical protein
MYMLRNWAYKASRQQTLNQTLKGNTKWQQ